MNHLVDRACAFYYFLDRNLTPIVFGKKYEYAAVSVIALRGAAFAALCLVAMIGLPLALNTIGIRVHGLLFLFIFTTSALLMLFCAKKGTGIIKKNSRQLMPQEIVRGFTGAVILTALLILAGLTISAIAQDIRIIDGDTFELDGEVIRLWGIDAPEPGQTCEQDGDVVYAGEMSAEMLANTLRDLEYCSPVRTDQHGRTVARCYTTELEGFGRSDISWAMVGLGGAWDYDRHSGGQYKIIQLIAQAVGDGIWSMDCIPPWEWRRAN